MNIFNDWLMNMIAWYAATDPYEEEITTQVEEDFEEYTVILEEEKK